MTTPLQQALLAGAAVNTDKPRRGKRMHKSHYHYAASTVTIDDVEASVWIEDPAAPGFYLCRLCGKARPVFGSRGKTRKQTPEAQTMQLAFCFNIREGRADNDSNY